MRTLTVDGASVTLVSGNGHRGLIASTDKVATRVEELQSTLGEGPAVDAVDRRHPVLSGDLTHRVARDRWPVFSSGASDAGVVAVFAVPLQIGVINLGVLTMHRRVIGDLSTAEFAWALRLADAAAYAVLDTDGNGAPGNDTSASTLIDEVFVGAEIHQASGMVMVQLNVPIDVALTRLRAYAFAHNRLLIDVAREVIARDLMFEG